MRVVAPEVAQTRVRSTPGGDLELVVHLSGPGAAVRWYKDGERLASQGRVQLEQAGARQVLRVRGARSRDAGEYLCDAPQDSRVFLVSVEGNSAPLTLFGPWSPKVHTPPRTPFWSPLSPHPIWLPLAPANSCITVPLLGPQVPLVLEPSNKRRHSTVVKSRAPRVTHPGSDLDSAPQ